ncbi:hypothetical protein [Mycobacterium sp. E787]|uniref:hypothetical protein n=1 Tax=Mycobacterium sp. E787 TaxID=1834150 RepID=UPI0012E9D6E4|nr:hypothetical protein [Mycobacterium sp. E787]
MQVLGAGRDRVAATALDAVSEASGSFGAADATVAVQELPLRFLAAQKERVVHVGAIRDDAPPASRVPFEPQHNVPAASSVVGHAVADNRDHAGQNTSSMWDSVGHRGSIITESPVSVRCPRRPG